MFGKAPYEIYAQSLKNVATACTDLIYTDKLHSGVLSNNPESLRTLAATYDNSEYKLKMACRTYYQQAENALKFFGVICGQYEVEPIEDNQKFLKSLIMSKNSEAILQFLGRTAKQCLDEQCIISPAEFMKTIESIA